MRNIVLTTKINGQKRFVVFDTKNERWLKLTEKRSVATNYAKALNKLRSS